MRNSIGKSTLLITASKLASLLINLACVMILSRIRTLEEYGTYSQLLMAVSLVSTLLIMGLPNSINYFLARADGAEERRSFLSHYYTLNALLCALSGALLVVCLPLLEAYFRNEAISTYAFFLLLYPFASITMSSVESVLVVYERPRTLVGYRLLNSLSLLGILLIADGCDLTFRQYMVLFLTTEFLFAVAVYVLAWRLCGGLRPAFSLSKLREIAVFCIPIGLASAVGTLSRELDKLVVSGFFSTDEYAIYTNAAKELPLTVLASATTMVILPKIVRFLQQDKKAQAVALWRDAFVVNYAVMAVLVFGIVTFAPEAVTILYSEKYLPGVTVFRIYTLLMLLRSTYWGMILNAAGRTKAIFRNSLLVLGLNVVLNLLFYYAFGFVGPAIATVAVIFISSAVYIRQTGKALHLPARSMIPAKPLLGITAINLLLSALFSALKAWLPLEAAAGALLSSLLSDRVPTEAMGQCAEAVLLGVVWVLVYATLLYRPIRRKWDALNDIEEES